MHRTYCDVAAVCPTIVSLRSFILFLSYLLPSSPSPSNNGIFSLSIHLTLCLVNYLQLGMRDYNEDLSVGGGKLLFPSRRGGSLDMISIQTQTRG